MTLKETLNQINKELQPRDPDSVFEEGVNIKLGRSEDRYEDIVKKNCMYILSRKNHKVMMAIDRYNRYKEKYGNGKESNYGFIETI